MFTDKQIQEIKELLSHLRIKDSDFKNLETLNSDTEFTLIRDNTNKKLSLETLLDFIKSNIKTEDTTDNLFPEYDAQTLSLESSESEEPVYYSVDVQVFDKNYNRINDATVIINNDYTDTTSILKDTRVSIVVSKSGYKIIVDSFILDDNTIRTYILEKE